MLGIRISMGSVAITHQSTVMQTLLDTSADNNYKLYRSISAATAVPRQPNSNCFSAGI